MFPLRVRDLHEMAGIPSDGNTSEEKVSTLLYLQDKCGD